MVCGVPGVSAHAAGTSRDQWPLESTAITAEACPIVTVTETPGSASPVTASVGDTTAPPPGFAIVTKVAPITTGCVAACARSTAPSAASFQHMKSLFRLEPLVDVATQTCKTPGAKGDGS